MSWELEQMYLDRRTGRVKESALRKEAVDLPSPILSFSEIKEQFGTAGTYKTTVQGIPVKIDVGYAYNHLSQNNNTHFEDRTRISGALYETLHNPFLIVKTQKGFTFYKPFRDGDKTLHLTSLHIDEKGKAKYKTFYEVNNLKKILEIIKTPERNVKFFSHSSRNQKKETSKPSDAPDSSPVPVGNPNDKKIIHKQAEFVNDIQQNTQIKKGNDMAANSNPTSSKKTYADHVSEKIIEAIEAGTAPWMRKWKGAELYGRSPYNGASDKPYKGINAVNLMITANALGYADPRWLTYKQAKSIDAQVKKGERGTVIQYWKFEERRDVVDDNGKPVLDEKGKPKRETVKLENPKVYFSTVFNAEQIENMPELKLESPLDFKPNETAENVLRNSGAEIEHKAGMSAYYMPGADKIVLPEKEQFVDEAGYYATALHELGHWTGHESRLDRDLSGNFGSESYAKEELRAEIGSYMLSCRLGIDFDPGNHFSYVDSWLKSLKEDKHEIFRASRDAEAISDYVMELSLEKNVHKEKVEEKKMSQSSKVQNTILDKSKAFINKFLQNPTNEEVQKEFSLYLQYQESPEMFYRDGELNTAERRLLEEQQIKWKKLSTHPEWNRLLAIEESREREEMSQSSKSNYVTDLSLEKNVQKEKVEEEGITMTETQHAWVQKKLDAGEPIYLDNNRVIMENLRGGTVESVKSEGLFVFTGEQGNMKPSTQLSETEAKEMILERYNELNFVHSPVNLNEAVYLDHMVLKENDFPELQNPKVESILALSLAKELDNLEKGSSADIEVIGKIETYAAVMNDQGLGVALNDHPNNDIKHLNEVTQYFAVLSDENKPYITFDDFMERRNELVASLEKALGDSFSNTTAEKALAEITAKEFNNLEKGAINSYSAETMGLLESYAAAMNDQGLGVALLDHSNDDRKFLGEVTQYFAVLSDDNKQHVSFDDFMEKFEYDKKISSFSNLKEYIKELEGQYPKLITLTAVSMKNDSLYSNYMMMNDSGDIKTLHITHDGRQEWEDITKEAAIEKLERSYLPHIAKEWEIVSQQEKNLERDQSVEDYKEMKAGAVEEKLEKQTYLFVPYSEKDDAKKVGAKWDKENKAWYAEKGTPSKPLEKWALENVKFDTLNLQTTGDYVKDFVAELNARGFEVDHLETDGRIRNVKVEGNKGAEKSGAYAVHTDGRPVLWYKNHRTGETGSITHRESSFEAGADKKEIKKYEELNRIRILQRDKDTERMHNEVSSRLQGEYQKLPSVQSHPYLQEKGIDQPDKAVKIDEKGNLLIPFVDANGEIKTVQRIPQQPQEGKFPKYWEKGGEKSGNFALIGADKISEVKEFVLCEGYATGETLHKALDMPVVVAGDSGNLSRVALKIIDANPDVKYKVTIAADNDVHITKPIENPGLTKARDAEKEIKARVEKVTLLKPTFSKSDREKIKNPSDFNDLEKVKGIDAVKSQIAAQRYARQRAEDIQKEKAQPNQTRSREPKKETAREMGR